MAGSVAGVYIDDGDALSSTRRIRHIASIQVRNLTAFPVRDAFTSALSQSSDLNQAGSYYAADDINLTASRRRVRKISTNSVGSKSAIKWDDALPEEEGYGAPNGSIRGRKTSGSKVNFASSGSAGSIRGSTYTKVPRPRTSSKASSASSRTFASSSLVGGSSSMAVAAGSSSSFLSDNTQKGLEKVIGSRLLETRLMITVLEPAQLLENGPISPHSAHRRSTATNTFDAKSKAHASPLSAPSTRNHFRQLSAPRSPSIADKSFWSPSPESPTSPRDSHFEVLETHTGQANSGHARNHVASPGTPTRTRSRFNKANGVSLDIKPFPPEPTQLNYLSPPHRPSTNPEFVLDAAFLPHLAEWTNLKAQSLRVTIWGKIPLDTPGIDLAEPLDAPPFPEEDGFKWKTLDEWDVNLTELVPVPDEVANRTDFPSNTLLLTLSPQGRTYRLPSPGSVTPIPVSISNGYSSDPESTGRKPPWQRTEEERPSHRVRRRGHVSAETEDLARTATWPDIFQLATLQAYIMDNNTSLDSLIRKIDEIVREDDVFPLRREISERQDRVGDLRKDQHTLIEKCSQKRLDIQERRAELDRRREALLIVREQDEAFEELQRTHTEAVSSERVTLEQLRSNIASIRASLIATLSDIFPIELLSPPDLLFTILEAPLPIPLSSNDPAPPLSLPTHKEVNEDSIAAALGFVAEVLRLLSAYLGTNLLYPVTCIGSRSLIRDSISSMVGPRTFPLYSKGVDTYRFEYGVFLLNKDIELLMAEKDLRALDMRHTLPNLKNLLLILSHDSSGRFEQRKRKPPESDTPLSTILELTPDSGPSTENTTPRPSASASDSQTPPRSGATTPTPINPDDARKGRSFLGLAPLTDFLRGRYPSSVRDSSKDYSDDEEDKRTIHGVTCDTVTGSGNSTVVVDTREHEGGENDSESESAGTPESR